MSDRVIDNDRLRQERADAFADHLRVHHLRCDALDRIRELEAQAEEDAARMGNLRRENEALRYGAIKAGLPLVDRLDQYGSKTEHYPLSRCLDLMDAWREDVERWGLHQMCRRLREAWLVQCRDGTMWEKEAHRLFRDEIRSAYEASDLRRRRARALAAIPCSAGIDNCHAPYYRHQPCCNLRVALWPGEEFHVEQDPVEPTSVGWLDAVNEHDDVPQSIREAGNRPMQGGPVV